MANFRIHFLDMGDTKYGDCIVVEAEGRRILIDGGHSNDFDGQDGYTSIPDQIGAILDSEPPYKFDLLVVTHVHADHVGCLPKMFDAQVLDIDHALVADPALGFGRTDGGPDWMADAGLTTLERGLIAAGTEQDYSDLPSDEIVQFLLDAAKLEDVYKAFLKDLQKAGVKVTRYVGQSMSQLESKFADVGLRILGPTEAHLERCARATAKAARANAKRTRKDDGFATDAVDAVARYREMFANRVKTDAGRGDFAADFVRDGKNNTSIVLALSVDGKSALLAGDMQFADAMIAGMEQDMLDIRQAVKDAGPYDVVKTSHHTSFNGLNDDVLADYAGTKLFIHSGGRRDPDHPDTEALGVLKAVKNEIKFARTDRNGLITVQLAPGTAKLELSQGKVNVFTLNPKNAPDLESPLPRVPIEGISLTRQESTDRGHIEVVARIPHQSTRVTVTVDIEPRAAAAAIDQRPAQPAQPARPARLAPANPPLIDPIPIAAGRRLPKLLFVTQPDQLAANIGIEEARHILASLQQAGITVVELPAGTKNTNDAVKAVREHLPGDYKGVVLLGGYDVVPPQRLDTLDDPTREQLERNPEMGEDPDDFFVWSDDGYVDFDGDGHPEMPISRIPDGMSARLVTTALNAKATESTGKYGIRNLMRPFADGVWALVPGGNQPLPTSHPLTVEELDGSALQAANLYLMLHGDSRNGRRFVGETEDGEYPPAIDVDAVKDVSGAIVFAGCCWGALCGERLANEPGPVVARALGNSIAMTFLQAGARAFIGCTGVHYSPDPDENVAGRPMHDAFWNAIKNGTTAPAEALFAAKREYAKRLEIPGRPVALRAVERKIYGEFTCLGLGW